ncbi:MAG: hypothetical protein LC648_09010 [Novosphingobium sp.]|nr:hypothetical protein [Novosphingobium sp.]
MNKFSMSLRAASLGVAALAVAAALPAQAQFGFNLGGAKKSSETTAEGCPQGKKKSIGASILGSVAGSVASRAAGKFATFVPIPEVASTLTNAIACKLDEKEQKQAAEATLAATRGDEAGEVAVGSTAEWTSASRPEVKGKSTVLAVNEGPGKGMPKDAKCITVSDVIIVNGEETTANKRMCRAPGSARYALMA